jgi:hypothetical protein
VKTVNHWDALPKDGENPGQVLLDNPDAIDFIYTSCNYGKVI